MAFLDKILGDPSKRFASKLQPIIERINSLEPNLEKLSDELLRGKTLYFKKRLSEGQALDDLLPEAFAAVREASRRTLGQRHFDVQMIGGIVLHQGKIAEMKTGEGKTLAATLPLYLNALEGKGCHLVTVNDYLAKRDTVWMGQIYHLLGLTIGCLTHESAYLYDPMYQSESQISNVKSQNELDGAGDKERDVVGGFKVIESYLRSVSRKEAYWADITYGTNNEFGFDYLRDNMVYRSEDIAQRKHHYAIVDEVDSILIDEARTPLIISQPDVESSKMYEEFSKITPSLKENSDYNIDEKMKAVTLTEEGIYKIEKILGVDNIYAEKGMKYLHYLEQALRAEIIFRRDRDYIVKEGQVVIVDEFTGRLLPGRRYSEGLHQAIEAKEGVRVQPESLTLASITFQNYFRLYKKLAGMTGTAVTSAEEFDKVYNLEVVTVPTNKPMIRRDLPDKIFKSETGKFRAIVEEIKKRHEKGQSLLVGTTSIAKNELLGQLLEREGIAHQILNAKHHEKEGEIIAQAGRLEAVTVATNMAGRGVDIILGGNPPDEQESSKVREAGGLFVIGTERHEARRIDNQLRGRSGRQGDPGASQFFVSLEDDLMRIFGGDRIKGLMEKLHFPEDQPIESGFISKALEEAQSRIEGVNLDLRQHLLEYDEVLNKHREVIYKKRREAIENENKPSYLKEKIMEMFEKELGRIIDFHCAGSDPADWNLEEIFEDFKTILPAADAIHQKVGEIAREKLPSQILRDKIYEYLMQIIREAYERKEEEAGSPNMRQIEKIIYLRSLDFLWIDHLTVMDHLRDSVRLRAYGQQDPLVEYKTEGHKMFQQLLSLFEGNVSRTILRAEFVKERSPQQNVPLRSNMTENSSSAGFKAPVKKVGRNDPCPCGAKKADGRPVKYKHCHGKNA